MSLFFFKQKTAYEIRISDWSSDVCSSDLVHDPAVILRRGRSYIFDLRNETAWWHPIHLHGHVLRVIARNGAPTPYREWQDTVLCAPHERVEIAFVADNPGDWMLHCHVLAHQAGGMMSTIRVARLQPLRWRNVDARSEERRVGKECVSQCRSGW